MAFKSNAAEVNKAVKEISDGLRKMQADMRALTDLFVKRHVAEQQAMADQKERTAAEEKATAIKKKVDELEATRVELLKKHAPAIHAMSSSVADANKHVTAFNTLNFGGKLAVGVGTVTVAVTGFAAAVNVLAKAVFNEAVKNYTDTAVNQIRGSKMMRDNAFETMKALSMAGNTMSRAVGFSANESVKLLGTTVAAFKRAGNSDTIENVGMLSGRIGNLGKTAGMGVDAITDANDFLVGSMRMGAADLERMFQDVQKTAGIYGIDGNKAMAAVKANENLLRGFTKDQREHVASKMLEAAGVFYQAGVDMGTHIDKLGGNKTGFDAIKSAAIIASQAGGGMSASQVMGLMSRAKAGDTEAQAKMGELKDAAIKRTTGMGVGDIKKIQADAVSGSVEAQKVWDSLQMKLRAMEEVVLPLYDMKSWDDVGQFRNDSMKASDSMRRGRAVKPEAPDSTRGRGASVENTSAEVANSVKSVFDRLKLMVGLTSETAYDGARSTEAWTNQFGEAVGEFSKMVGVFAASVAASGVVDMVKMFKAFRDGGKPLMAEAEILARGGKEAAKAGAPLLPKAVGKEAAGAVEGAAANAAKSGGSALKSLAKGGKSLLSVGGLAKGVKGGLVSTAVDIGANAIIPKANEDTYWGGVINELRSQAIDTASGAAGGGVIGAVIGAGISAVGKVGRLGMGLNELWNPWSETNSTARDSEKARMSADKSLAARKAQSDALARSLGFKDQADQLVAIKSGLVKPGERAPSPSIVKAERQWSPIKKEEAPAEPPTDEVVDAINEQTKTTGYASRDMLSELRRLREATESRGNTVFPAMVWGMAT